IFVEGYFDVLKMHINGIKNAVAPMGTAITKLHLNLLKKLTDKILLLFDGDDPGIRAALRNLETIIKMGFEIKICMLPSGFDPDKFIDEYGAKSLMNFIEKSQDFVDFSISINSQIYDIKNPKEKSTIIKETIKLISKVPDEIERYEFLKKLSEKMGIKIEILENYLEEMTEKNIETELLKRPSKINQDSAEKFLIEIVMNDKKYLDKLFELKGQLTEKIEKIIVAVEKLMNKRHEINPSLLMSECEDEELINFISSIVIKDNNKIPEDLKEKIFNDCIKKIKKKRLLSEIEIYKKKMNEKLEKGIDYKDDLKEIQKLLYKLKRE
ncbi:MAG: toprim domain-containing protein, partial [Candidatus Ratteibacteria bacterium]